MNRDSGQLRCPDKSQRFLKVSEHPGKGLVLLSLSKGSQCHTVTLLSCRWTERPSRHPPGSPWNPPAQHCTLSRLLPLGAQAVAGSPGGETGPLRTIVAARGTRSKPSGNSATLNTTEAWPRLRSPAQRSGEAAACRRRTWPWPLLCCPRTPGNPSERPRASAPQHKTTTLNLLVNASPSRFRKLGNN